MLREKIDDLNAARAKMFEVRQSLQNAMRGDEEVAQNVKHVEGLMTCGIVSLFDSIKELEKSARLRPKE